MLEPVFERVWWNPLTWFLPTRTIVRTESEWSRDQADALLGYLAYKNDLGRHGQPLSEAMSPLGDASSWDSEWFYQVGAPVVDHAEKAVVKAREAYKKDHPDADLSYVLFPVKKVHREKRSNA